MPSDGVILTWWEPMETRKDDYLSTDAVADLYRQVRAVEAKIQEAVPDAEFELLPGSSEEFRLHVFSDREPRDVLDLIDDELDEIEDRHHVLLTVLTLPKEFKPQSPALPASA